MEQGLKKLFDHIVLGTTVPTGKNFAGDSRRPSYEQAKDLKDRLFKDEFLPNSTERQEFIIAGLEQLADGSLSGADLGRFDAVVSALAHGYYEKVREGEYNHADIADGLTRMKARIAHGLSMAVGYLEGNIAPNDLGYFAEQTLSLVRLDEVVVDGLKAAHESLTENPELFGPNSIALYNAIAARVGSQRPTFGGISVRPNVQIPLFDTAQPGGEKPATISPMR